MGNWFEDVLGGAGRFIDRTIDDIAWRWRMGSVRGGFGERIRECAARWTGGIGGWCRGAAGDFAWRLRVRGGRSAAMSDRAGEWLTRGHAMAATAVVLPAVLCVVISWRLNRAPDPEPYTEREMSLLRSVGTHIEGEEGSARAPGTRRGRATFPR